MEVILDIIWYSLFTAFDKKIIHEEKTIFKRRIKRSLLFILFLGILLLLSRLLFIHY